MMLLVTTLLLGPFWAALLGTITPLVAALRGQLPSVLIPMVPFIIIANVLFVFSFFSLNHLFGQHKTRLLLSIYAWIALFLASFLKYIWLFLSVRYLLLLFVGKEVPKLIIAMMSFPQFYSAFLGGLIAFIIFDILKTRLHLSLL